MKIKIYIVWMLDEQEQWEPVIASSQEHEAIEYALEHEENYNKPYVVTTIFTETPAGELSHE